MESPKHSRTTSMQPTQNSSNTTTNTGETYQPQDLETSTDQHVTLRIDFKWGKFKSLVSDINKPNDPLYIIQYKPFSSKQFIYRSAPTEKVIGTGSVHVVNIDAEYECRGRRDTLVAQRRLHTLYTHRSGYLKNSDGQPTVMTWTGDIGTTTWDFICTDEQQMPVAKFTANLWGLRKIGKIELMGPSAHQESARDEMLVTGMTLAYCMAVRFANIFSLFGSAFADPGHDKKYKSEPLPVDDGQQYPLESLPQQSTAVYNGQADVRHRQTQSGPSTEIAPQTAIQSAAN
ncbi:hypothetical protein N7466_000790 [Penicillium verhagenii]|uniref:uncharacterized protein n=1 Tax=Penicillium verhagenii TaxID=1562060 RepID=UPI0025451F31|nr:uncharacterized protein N7466_000790 [Penicillium verhagenii]KAJ5947775.1 hypothetical protein N7466_000790 [Penicillium verhagenii]